MFVPFEPIRLGGRTGRKALIDHFERLSTVGVDHVAINLRASGRALAEVMEELAAEVMPALEK